MNKACSSTSLMASFLPPNPTTAHFSSSNSLFFSSSLSKSRPTLVSARRRSRPAAGGALGCRCLFGLGVPEVVVIAGVATLLFGPKKLPEVGRSIGKTFKSFQQAAKEFETELKKDPEAASDLPPPAETAKAVTTEDEKKELNASGLKES